MENGFDDCRLRPFSKRSAIVSRLKFLASETLNDDDCVGGRKKFDNSINKIESFRTYLNKRNNSDTEFSSSYLFIFDDDD